MSKKKNLDTLMQEAIVRVEEQPYEIPENWFWTDLKAISTYIQRGKSPKYVEQSDVKVVSQKCVQWSGFDISLARCIDEGSLKSYKEERYLRKTDILWNSTGTGTIGRLALIEDDLEGINVADSHVTVVRPNDSIVNSKLLFRWLSSPYVQNKLNNLWSGSTNQVELNLTTVKNQLVPIPPYKEQKRIVEKVERILNKIEEAKRLIEEAKKTFEIRRAAILDKAFRGELTRKWREENSSEIFTSGEKGPYQLPKEWQWTTIGEITSFVGSGSTPKGGSEVYQKRGIPFIRSQNVLRNEMSIDDIVYITEEIHSNMKRTHMHGNETLLNITGASIGRATKLKKELVPCNINQHVCALRFIAEINEELPQYWLNSWFLQKEINELQIGATRQALNFPQVKSLPFPLIPKEEQKEILRIMNDLLAKENKLAILGDMDREIDTLKQSILSKAFQGELGTNNPNEENSIELLKEILQKQVK